MFPGPTSSSCHLPNAPCEADLCICLEIVFEVYVPATSTALFFTCAITNCFLSVTTFVHLKLLMFSFEDWCFQEFPICSFLYFREVPLPTVDPNAKHLSGTVEKELVYSGGPFSVGYHHPEHLESDWDGAQTLKPSRNNTNSLLIDDSEVFNDMTDGDTLGRAPPLLSNLSAAFRSVTASSFSEQTVVILAVLVGTWIFHLSFPSLLQLMWSIGKNRCIVMVGCYKILQFNPFTLKWVSPRKQVLLWHLPEDLAHAAEQVLPNHHQIKAHKVILAGFRSL